MDLKSSHVSPILTDPVLFNKSRLQMHSRLLAYSKTFTVNMLRWVFCDCLCIQFLSRF